jgi:hypothetical protein
MVESEGTRYSLPCYRLYSQGSIPRNSDPIQRWPPLNFLESEWYRTQLWMLSITYPLSICSDASPDREMICVVRRDLS